VYLWEEAVNQCYRLQLPDLGPPLRKEENTGNLNGSQNCYRSSNFYTYQSANDHSSSSTKIPHFAENGSDYWTEDGREV
jgi:hypothetical protein